MGTIYLRPGDTVGVYSSSRIYGSTGTERVHIMADGAPAEIAGTVEQVHFLGATGDYAFRSAGGVVEILHGGAVAARVTPASGAQTTLRFSDGGMRVAVNAETGVISLNGTAISTTPAPFAGTPDPALVSEAGGLPDPGPTPDPDPKPDPGPTPDPDPDPTPDPDPDPTPDPDPDPTPDPDPDPDPRPDPVPGGIFVIRGREWENIIGTFGDDLYDGRQVENALVRGTTIVDPSPDDSDVLYANLNASNTGANANGHIANIETVNVLWSGITVPTADAPTFDGRQVTHPREGGSLVVVSNARSDILNAVVVNGMANTYAAGDSVLNTFEVRGLIAGGGVRTGNARHVVMDGIGEGHLYVENDCELTIEDASYRYAGDSVTLHLDADATVRLTRYASSLSLAKAGAGSLSLVVPTVDSHNYDFHGFSGVDSIRLESPTGALAVTEGQALTLDGAGDIVCGASYANGRDETGGCTPAGAGRSMHIDIDNDFAGIGAFAFDAGRGYTVGLESLEIGVAATVNGGVLEGNDRTEITLSGEGGMNIGTVRSLMWEAGSGDAAGAYVKKVNAAGGNVPGAGPGIHAEGLKGYIVVDSMEQGKLWAGDAGCRVTLTGDSVRTHDLEVGVRGLGGVDTLVIDGAEIAGQAEFYGGGGNDVVRIGDFKFMGATTYRGQMELNMGDGDDLVYFTETLDETHFVDAGEFKINFGEEPGDADVLRLARGVEVDVSTGPVSIEGMDILDLVDQAKLTVTASQISGRDFALGGAGGELRITTVPGLTTDLTRIAQAPSNSSRVHVREKVDFKGMSAEINVFQLGAAAEVLHLAPCNIRSIDTVHNFAPGMDRFWFFSTEFGDDATRLKLEGEFRQIPISLAVTSLTDALSSAVRQLGVSDGTTFFSAGYIVYNGDTFVVATRMEKGRDHPSFGKDDNDCAVRLAGTGYDADLSDFAYSVAG